MHALLLTVFVSLVLAAFFLLLFLREGTAGGSISSSERDALLPFGDGDDAPAPGVLEKAEAGEAPPGPGLDEKKIRET